MYLRLALTSLWKATPTQAPAGFTGIEVTVNSSDSAQLLPVRSIRHLLTTIPRVNIYNIGQSQSTITLEVTSTIPECWPIYPNFLGLLFYDTSQGFTIGDGSTT